MDNKILEFEKLYDEFGDPVFRYFFTRINNRDRALEMTQETFMKIWTYMSSGKKIEYQRAFVFRSAHNAFVNEIRTNKKSFSLDTMMDEGFELKSEINEMDVRESLETQKEVLEKIKHLPDEDKEVLILRYVEGLELSEICNVLRVTENHASVKIHRAKQKLKKIYEQ